MAKICQGQVLEDSLRKEYFYNFNLEIKVFLIFFFSRHFSWIKGEKKASKDTIKKSGRTRLSQDQPMSSSVRVWTTQEESETRI